MNCNDTASKMSPLSFVIDNYLFEIQPKGYLINGTDIDASYANMCVIGLSPNPASTKSSHYTMFTLGDALLRSFYAVYNLEDSSMQLAVNIHS
jgi:hypothetical protein